LVLFIVLSLNLKYQINSVLFFLVR